MLATIDAHHDIADRHIAIARGMVYLTPVLNLTPPGSSQHFHDLGSTFVGDRLDPVGAHPIFKSRKLIGIIGRIEDCACVIQHQRHIACEHGKLHRRIGIQRVEQVRCVAERILTFNTMLACQHSCPGLEIR